MAIRPIPGMVKTVEYKDIDLFFRPNPNTGDVAYLTNDKAITRAIKNLVLADFFERPYKSRLGSGVMKSVFELFSPAEVTVLRNRIRDVIRNYEPRAELLDVIMDWRPDEHEMKIDIYYRPINAKEPVIINLFLRKLR